MWHGLLLAISFTALLKTGSAVKCYECSANSRVRGYPPFTLPTGGCWNDGFESSTARVIDCPYTCMAYRRVWTDSANKTVSSGSSSMPIVTFHNTTELATLEYGLVRGCGSVGPDYDFDNNKCKYSGGTPPKNVSMSLTYCCANDFCNGYPTGPQRPATTPFLPNPATTPSSGPISFTSSVPLVFGILAMTFWTT